jgi:hypothetical protein
VEDREPADSGRIWEAVHARRERRRPLDLYHTALVVRVPEGRFVIENSWPTPAADGAARGVVVQGPVGSADRGAGRCSARRYASGGTGSSPTPTRRWPARSC